MSKNSKTVGIAGIGKMGAAIAARLAEMGTDVRVWNRSRKKAEITGLSLVSTPRALSEQCDIVLTSLFDATAIEAVYGGPEGLLSGASDKLFVEMSTVAPSEHVQLASAIARAGGKLLECAVGGTVGPARTGQLLGLVGGDSEDLERARPVLERFCRRVELMGPIGAGASAKLAVNLPLIVFWQAFGEAVAMMRDVDKDPEWLVDLFNETAGAANVLKLRSAAVAATLAGSDTVPPGFDIDSMRKDVGTMVRVAR